ncbi:MAG: shikimate kinase [Saprospiraceae bacterium]
MIRQDETLSSDPGMKILLTGMMGCGKSSTARILGQQLGMPVLDLDSRIEHLTQMTIPMIFSHHGEVGFRELEYQELGRILNWPGRAIIALGGGAICQERNRAIIVPPHVTIYLRCDVELLVARLESSQAQRPLLTNGVSDLRDRIVQLMGERQQWYEQADVVIDVHTDGRHLLSLRQWIRSLDRS